MDTINNHLPFDSFDPLKPNKQEKTNKIDIDNPARKLSEATDQPSLQKNIEEAKSAPGYTGKVAKEIQPAAEESGMIAAAAFLALQQQQALNNPLNTNR
jgi:hypothetical protein